MPAKETTRKGVLGDLQQLSAALTANSEELRYLEGSRRLFEGFVAQAQEIATRQAALVAAKQEASQQLKLALGEGLRHAHILRLAVKAHYGIRAEKLAEFGLQPFRGRKRVASTPEPELEAPAPAAAD